MEELDRDTTSVSMGRSEDGPHGAEPQEPVEPILVAAEEGADAESSSRVEVVGIVHATRLADLRPLPAR